MSALVQYVPGHTFFHRLDPRTKIIFMLLVTVGIFVVTKIWVAMAVLFILLSLWFVAGLPLRVLKGYARALMWIIAFLFVVQALFYPGQTVLVSPIVPESVPLLGGVGQVTLEGILFAFLLALRLMSMIIVLPLVSLTTPINLLSLGLVRLGLPYRLAYTMTTAMNLIPVLQDEARIVMDAQRLRALQIFEKGNFLQKLKAYPSLVTPLVIGAMRRAQLIAVAMDSRAFGSGRKRSYIHNLRMKRIDWAFLTSLAILGSILVLVNCLVRNSGLGLQ